jgi:hypothetical protein
MKGIIRPKARVLGSKALVPKKNLIRPHPNQFTHELTRRAPYYFAAPQPGAAADGELPAGTPVVLLTRASGPYSWVVDGQGLYVAVRSASLKKL